MKNIIVQHQIEKIQVKDNKYLPFQYHKYLINYFI